VRSLLFSIDVAARFLYEPEIDALLADASLRDSMGARRRAIDLVRIAGEWLDASRVDPSALRVKADRLEKTVLDRNRETRQEWLARIQDPDFGKARLRREFDKYTLYTRDSAGNEHYGSDDLDELLGCIIGQWPALEYAPRPEAELIHYEPVPARVVLEMIDLANLDKSHIFYDIGSGLGRVNMLVSMLTDAVSVGVEIDRDLADRAEHLARAIDLPRRPRYICSDACSTDTADGTVFFLFTPFVGSTLVSFIEKLLRENVGALLCSYGDCTAIIGSIPGIKSLDPSRVHPFKLGLFST
jgi:hypothetical protein